MYTPLFPPPPHTHTYMYYIDNDIIMPDNYLVCIEFVFAIEFHWLLSELIWREPRTLYLGKSIATGKCDNARACE